jgi:uncharacterized protein (TIGR02996 family)
MVDPGPHFLADAIMPDEAALLDAVLREPEADGPRRAYADWMQSLGGAANLARADFIRVQIDLENAIEEDRQWPELARRERELLAQWQTTWEKPFRDLLKPSVFRPARWIKARLFGQGGMWRFHRGFIEEIDCTASGFLEEDGLLFGRTPIRRAVLSNSTSLIAALAADPRLDDLYSLHLIADAEFDDEMEGLRQAASTIGLTVVEMRFPRIQSDAAELFAVLLGDQEDPANRNRLADFCNWRRASERERERLWAIARRPRLVQRLIEPEHFSHAEMLRINDWIYLGDRLREAGAWAVVKTFHDLEDDDGLCRRIVLFKKNRIQHEAYETLMQSPHLFRG